MTLQTIQETPLESGFDDPILHLEVADLMTPGCVVISELPVGVLSDFDLARAVGR